MLSTQRLLHDPVIHGCTIIARNYFAHARVLARSFRVHHPDARFSILVVDDVTAAAQPNEPYELLRLSEIGLEPGEAERMALIYDVVELSTAVKPFLLRQLRRAGHDVVVYFDPDIEISAPLNDLAAAAREHSIVLTPHVLQPMPRDGLRPTETDILGAGIYNLGFIMVGPGSEAFLDWWAVRLRRECIIDPPGMRFTDQRWIDFVPALFRHYIVRDPACNVAYWNLDHRRLAWTGRGYEVDGRPLRFFHFSGYEPDAPDVLSKFQEDSPRVVLATEPAVAKICGEYREKLMREGHSTAKVEPYGYGLFGAGVPIDRAMRRVYRTALEHSETTGNPAPPNPFCADDEDAFVRWLNEPMQSGPAVVTRYMLALHSDRPDLQHDFPNPLGESAAAFHAWFIDQACDWEGARRTLVPPSNISDEALIRERALVGENVIGKVIDFSAAGASERYRLRGWSRPEPGFTWSAATRARLALPVARDSGALVLEVKAEGLMHPPALPMQPVEVYVYERRVAEWQVAAPAIHQAFLPADVVNARSVLIVEFRMARATSPLKLRKNADPRVLGICVYHLRLMPQKER